MASINGIQIKSLKDFKDHEGITISQGNIYYKGQKLGFWSEDTWGGPDMYHFDESILDEEVKRYVASDMVKDEYKEFSDLGCLLAELRNLMDIEKGYKKCVKAGYKTYVYATDGYYVSSYFSPVDKEATKKLSYHKQFVEDCKKKFRKGCTVTVTVNLYDSLDDFNITV